MPRPETLHVDCACGAAVDVVAHSLVNVEAAPELQRQMEAGTFHHGVCPACAKHVQIEKWFLYQDPGRGLLVHVFPRGYREAEAALRAQLSPLHELCGLADDGPVRVVFGIDGLLAFLRAEQRPRPGTEPRAPRAHATRH